MRVLTWAYRRLGRAYPRTFIALELLTAFPIILGTYALFSFYYEGSFGDFASLFGITCALAAIALVVGCTKTWPLLKPVERWIGGERDEDSTAKAWAAAVSFPWRMIRTVALVPVLLVVIPASIISVAWLGLTWLAFFPFFAGSMIALAYSAMLHYLAVEVGLRPVLVDINQQVAPRRSGDVSALSLRWRLLLTLPLINAITGMTVAALTSEGGGGADLGLDVAIAVGVATTIALELTVLVSKSVLRPIADLQRATDAVMAGDYDVSVPVTTGDETGDLAASFNEMVLGLRERERIREAFGTYLDNEVAEYILSDGFTEEGVEVEVSVLFCDVRDFTGFAAGSEAQEVVAGLNRLFEQVVPVISRHGGHVDKFVGDGLLAVFGAPRRYPDHADRATRAAIEIAHLVNHEEAAGELRIGIGINSGQVVAGAIGGGGRLDFSVIGDAVNIASRVEAATRDLGIDVLLTAATVADLTDGIELEPLGPQALKGVADPVELFAPREPETLHPGAPSPVAEPAVAAAAGRARGRLRRRLARDRESG